MIARLAEFVQPLRAIQGEHQQFHQLETNSTALRDTMIGVHGRRPFRWRHLSIGARHERILSVVDFHSFAEFSLRK